MKLSEIHHTLCNVRQERNIAQKDIAAALNVEQATISMYETGKRGIPLDILDSWLQLLEIEVKITPKGFEPTRAPKDTEDELQRFNELKTRRNYLTAELRAMMAEQVLRVPEFQRTDKETGEGVFWPYSFRADPFIGLVETRYDHPEQKYMAVEYTNDEVNVYKFLSAHESENGKSDQDLMGVNRIYFSEDDFLMLSAQWEQDDMERRKMTVLRKSNVHPDGVEIIDPEGFSIRTLAEMMENHQRFSKAIKELDTDFRYINMDHELDSIGEEMLNIVLNNRLVNGTSNPDFIFWSDEDLSVIDVPLADSPRSWFWIEEGVEWAEKQLEIIELETHTT